MSTSRIYQEQLVGVFGQPVAENPTVVMHQAAFAVLGLPWRYLTIEVAPEDLEAAMRGLRAFRMRGINLTIPHKVAVLRQLDEVRPAAALMGAVNTVVRDGDRLIGENTDGKGFMRALSQDAGVNARGKRAVVLGAGGAARAITVELALAGAAQVTVVNRSAARGQALVELLAARTPARAELVVWSDTYAVPGATDLLVNATSIGLPPDVAAVLGPYRDYLAEHAVDPDRVRPLQRTARVVEPQDHSGVDVARGADAFCQRERRLVDHLAHDPSQHEARRVAHPRDVLAERGEEALGPRSRDRR